MNPSSSSRSSETNEPISITLSNERRGTQIPSYRHKHHRNSHEIPLIDDLQREKQLFKNQHSLILPKSIFCEFHDKDRKYLPEYSISEIVKHYTEKSCWIIVGNLVLDITNFMKYHPGGKQCLLKYGGCVCDQHYQHHSRVSKKLFWKFVVGKLRISPNNKMNKCIIL